MTMPVTRKVLTEIARRLGVHGNLLFKPAGMWPSRIYRLEDFLAECFAVYEKAPRDVLERHPRVKDALSRLTA